eukprot:4774482-Pyramimonas_sp.AAC.1
MLFPLPEKPKGGVRPVALCAALVRLWGELRMPLLAAAMDKHARRCWAFGAGKSAEACVRGQSVKAEAKVEEGGVAAGFDLELLRPRALEAGPGPTIFEVTFDFWRRPRILRLGSDHSLATLHASRWLPGGSCVNDLFVKVYAMQPFGGFVCRSPSVDLSSHIDDDTVSCYGQPSEVPEALSDAATDLRRDFFQEFRVNFSPDKLMTSASASGLA